MDPPPPHPEPHPDERIAALINAYFDRRRAGEDLTAEAFAAEHPELAEQLRPYLEGLSLLDRLRPPSEEEAAAEATAEDESDLPAIDGYELQEEIGRGGMGVVYRAEQISTRRIVALKVILAGPFASRSSRRRFKREVQLAARLKHPNIVRVLESGQVAQQQYYAMDFVAGAPLDQWLITTRPDTPTVLSVFERLCRAVDYAHGQGVIHRDLKPANILVDAEGQGHILDFGLGKATDPDGERTTLADRVSQSGDIVGTLPYISPEQASPLSGDVDGRTDVYTLGVLLFEALTGALPHETSGHPSQVLQRILEEPPRPPSSLSDRVRGEVETIILKALEHDPARRYQTAGEMAEDIRRYLDGEPILARRPSSLYVLRKKLVKHRLAATLAAAALLIALVLGAAHTWGRYQHRLAGHRSALMQQQALERDPAGQSISAARSIFERFPDVPEAALLWAQAQYRNEDMRNGAILFLEQQIMHDPSRWACRALLAEIYRTSGYPERAEELRVQAERDAPDDADAWHVRSFATFDLQRALQCAEESISRDPDHRLARHRSAHLRRQVGDLDGALAEADALIARGEDAGRWKVFKGNILAQQGRFRPAIEVYTDVIANHPSELNAHLYRGHAYRRIREYELAVLDYDSVLASGRGTTEDAWQLYQRATPLWILGRTDEALEDYRRARVLLGRPHYADARRYLILHSVDRPQEARTVLAAALRDVTDPWRRQIYRCLAGEISPAQLIDDPSAQGDAENLCEAYYYAAEVCLLNGRTAEARGHFRRCVETGVQFDPNTSLAIPMNEFELAQWRLETALPDPAPAGTGDGAVRRP